MPRGIECRRATLSGATIEIEEGEHGITHKLQNLASSLSNSWNYLIEIKIEQFQDLRRRKLI